MSTDFLFNPRLIWVNADTKEFHWAKSADDVTKSKCINILTHIKSVKINSLINIPEPNFTIELVEAAQLHKSVFATKLFTSALPTTIDIRLVNAEINAAFVEVINQLKDK